MMNALRARRFKLCDFFNMILLHIRLALSTCEDFILSLPAVRISKRC